MGSKLIMEDFQQAVSTGYSNPELRVRPGEVGRPPGTGNKTSVLAQKEIFLRLAANGISLIECSKQLKISGITLAKWLREPGMMERLKNLNEIVWAQMDQQLKATVTSRMEVIQKASDEALDKLLELLHSADSEVVQMRCAMDLLDRNPETSKTRKVETTKRTMSISAEFLTLCQEADRESGVVIDG